MKEHCDGALGWGGGGGQIRHNARFIVFGLIFMRMNIKEQKGEGSLKRIQNFDSSIEDCT